MGENFGGDNSNSGEFNNRIIKIFQEISLCLAKAKNIDEGVNGVLKFIGEFLGVSRAYVFETYEGSSSLGRNTYEWCNEGIPSELYKLQTLQYDKYDYRKMFDDKLLFYCADTRTLAEPLKSFLQLINVKSVIQYAILDKGNLAGIVGIDDCVNYRRDWEADEEERTMVSFAANMLSLYLIKERNLERADRANAQMALEAKRAQENLDIVNDIIGSGMWYFDYNEQGKLVGTHLSQKFRKLLGYENKIDFPDELDSWIKTLHPDDRDAAVAGYEKGLKGEGEYHMKFRCKLKNGEYNLFESVGRCARYPNGNPRRYAGTFINVTMAENEAIGLTGRLDAVLGGVNGGLKICERATNYPYIYLSESVAAIQGYTPGELMDITGGDSILNIHPEDVDQIKDKIIEEFASTGSFSAKFRVRHRDGQWIWVSEYGKKVSMPDGKEYVYSLIQNTNEQELANIRLEAERAKYRDALLQNSIYSFSVDLNDKIIKDEIITKDGTKLVEMTGLRLPASYDEVMRRLHRVWGTEMLTPDGEAFLTIDGLKRLYEEAKRFDSIVYRIPHNNTFFRIIPLIAKDPSNGHLILSSFVYDISDEKRKEILQENALVDAMNRAERSNKAKTIFLSNMSHDIRTPMNAIIGYTNLAEENLSDEKRLGDYLAKIKNSSNYLLELINDVLDMSRIESGKIDLDETKNSITEIAEEIRSIVSADIISKKLNFKVTINNLREDRVICDRVRLSQVLLNCISNAIKYTPEGGDVELSINQVSEKIDDFCMYQIIIKDSGIGMSPEFAAKIFEPFERERNSTVSGIQGTGLGMAISRSLIEMMDGHISVFSVPGQGSEFTIELPLCYVQESADTTEGSTDARNNEESDAKDTDISERGTVEGLKILLVEDNELNREIAEEILTKYGTIVYTAENGQAAVDIIRHANEGDYDLILMDIQMPIMDGLEATRHIRNMTFAPCHQIPIIAMTANAFTEDRQAALEAGMNEHIAKPIVPKVLIETLRKWS